MPAAVATAWLNSALYADDRRNASSSSFASAARDLAVGKVLTLSRNVLVAGKKNHVRLYVRRFLTCRSRYRPTSMDPPGVDQYRFAEDDLHRPCRDAQPMPQLS